MAVHKTCKNCYVDVDVNSTGSNECKMVAADESKVENVGEKAATASSEAKESKKQNQQLFTIEVLKVIKEAQQQHGLRHDEYQRYRGYCSRRVRRMRKTLHMRQNIKRTSKKVEFSAALLKDERYLYIPLMLAERAWSYAMQLRQEAYTEPRKKFHLISKLRKATVYALQLQKLCESDKCDARSRMEAQAYVAWIHGSLHFELQLWDKALENLRKAQVAYLKIASALDGEDSLLYRMRAEELNPNIRYCAYNIGDGADVDAILEDSAAVAGDLTGNLGALSKRKDLSPSEQQSPAYQSRVKIERTIQKNLFLISGSKKILMEQMKKETNAETRKTRPQDLTRLYEIILQNLAELQQLPDASDDPEYQLKIEAKITAYKAFRCCYIAQSISSMKRWGDIAALYERAAEYANDALKNKLTEPQLKEELQALLKDISRNKSTALANSILELEQPAAPSGSVYPYKVNQKQKKIPLSERLNEYAEDPDLLTKQPNVMKLPPEMHPVHCKPLFFDLAYNLIEMPKVNLNQNKKGTEAGISGFVKGLWGWGGSKK